MADDRILADSSNQMSLTGNEVIEDLEENLVTSVAKVYDGDQFPVLAVQYDPYDDGKHLVLNVFISELSIHRIGLGRVQTFVLGSVGSDVKFQNILVQTLQKSIVLHINITHAECVSSIVSSI